MFDTYVSQSTRTEYVPYEKTVTVNRAPTDKSVELLNEFQEKAQNNLIQTVNIDSNVINGIAMFFNHDILMDKLCYLVRYTLNGEEFTHKGDIYRRDYPYIGTNDPATKFMVIRDFFVPKISEKIAEAILQTSANSLLNLSKP